MSAKASFTLMSALAGAAIWAVVALLAGGGHAPFGIIELLFLFAPLVIVPLGVELDRTVIPAGWGILDRAAVWLQPFGAALVVIAFWLPPGQRAAILGLPWACVCGLLALSGVSALLRRRLPLPTMLAHVGRFDLLIGAAWLLMSRLGAHPQRFQEPIILLAAVHFHYSGFGLATIAATTVHTTRLRSWRSKWLTASAALAVFLPFLIAAGFAFSATLKTAAALVLALSVIILVARLLQFSSGLMSWTARLYLRAASAFVLIGMMLAIIYAVGVFLGREWLLIPRMASTHGVLNGLGFTLLGLLGWLAEFHVSISEESRNSLRLPSQPSTEARWTRIVELDCTGLTFSARDFYDR